MYTLHVYTNTIQIPVLVLGPHKEEITKPIAENRFSVSIDDGPSFRATHARMEGDDPISLSILLDVSGDSAELMPKIGDAIASLAPQFLHPKDRVSIYAMDCSLVRSWNNLPAESVGLKAGVDSALRSWTNRKANKHEPKCQYPVHLWDAAAYAVSESRELPGRRVILVVSDGRDKGSKRSWSEVRAYAQSTGATIFGMTYLPPYMVEGEQMAGGSRMGSGNRIGGGNVVSRPSGMDDPFQALSGLSGGVVLSANKKSLEETLRRFTTILRERYIVEFPRPANATAGEHAMQVRVEKSGPDMIRWGGVTVPIPDAALLADPTTVPSDPSLTPQQGNHHSTKSP